MAPSSTLQARIKQFESMNSSHSSVELVQYPPARSFHPVAPVLTGASSVSSSSSPDLLGEPVSPTAASYTIIKPTIQVPYVARKPRTKSPSPSPPNLGLKTSLIDLKDWVVEDNPNGKIHGYSNGYSHPNSRAAAAPPLPPRKVSQTSSNSDSSSRSPAPRPPKQRSSNSLTVEHTYPPLSRTTSLSNMRQNQGHVHASSTSSFHSVSLSSDGGENPPTPLKQQFTTDSNSTGDSSFEGRRGDLDTSSLDDALSFETMSSASISSPSLSSTQEWDFMASTIKQEPPRLPARKPTAPINLPNLSSSRNPSLNSLPTNAPTARRVPPPVPGRQRLVPPSASQASSLKSASTSASDRSSISSASTATSISTHMQLLRPTPIPPIARKRYDALFFANVNAQRRSQLFTLQSGTTSNQLAPTSASSTTRKGWRGLSVDLIMHPEDQQETPAQLTDPGPRKLDREVVRVIWSRSKLKAESLRNIWLECASVDQDALDQDSFARGMWRIDEELRRSRSISKYNMHVPPSRSRQPVRKNIAIHSLLH
ncbi:hypothetical protein SCHPADRAFT_856598 [Schizopora paradoxa]|uniref:EH domain-containing protein n=1 Tax=Schizopora paradoxa TaxID=27342 RepID=A0A0H2RFT8_9AGAM|nr:hypothetical protein SCHPADRAFT_856598 [Schizopora paradoxa]